MKRVVRNKIAHLCAALAVAALCGGCARSPEQKQARYMEAGRKQMEKKDYARAILEFKNAVRSTPKQAEPYYQLGLAYLAGGDPKSAVRLFQKTLELNAPHQGAQLKLAQLMAMAGDPEVLKEAEKRATEMLAKTPDNADALDVLAIAELKLGKVEDAEKHLQQALARFPRRLQSSVELAKVRIAQRDLAGAEEVLKQAAAQMPPVADAAVALGEFYIAANRPAEAERQLSQALAIDPKNAAALVDLAGLQARAGRTDEAAGTIKRLSMLPGKEYKAAYGAFLFQTGKFNAAISEFERLAKEDPSDRVARSRLVAAYFGAGRRKEAERILTDALKKNGKDVDALLERSKVYLADRRYEDAEKDLNQVIHYRADSAGAHYLMSRLHQARGAALREREELSETLRLQPAMLQARVRLSRLLAASGAARTAVDVMEQAPQPQHKNPAYVAQHNWALLAAGDKGRVRQELDAALASARTPELLLQDAALKLEAKDTAGARLALEEALKLDPENTIAADLLARSYAGENKLAAGIEKLRQYAGARPQSATMQSLLGSWLSAAGNHDEARQAYTAALKANPRFTQAALALAQIDIAEGKLEAARRSLESLAASDTGPSARLLLGGLEERAGNVPAAIGHYRAVVERAPGNALALNNLAFLLAESGQTDEGLKYAQQAKELAPKSAAVDDTLGWAFYRKGIYLSAVKHLENAVREPTAVRKYHLAMAYMKAGDQKRGRQALQESMKLDPAIAEKVKAGTE